MTVLYRIIKSLGLLKHLLFFLSDRLYYNSYAIQHVIVQFLRQRSNFTFAICPTGPIFSFTSICKMLLLQYHSHHHAMLVLKVIPQGLSERKQNELPILKGK